VVCVATTKFDLFLLVKFVVVLSKLAVVIDSLIFQALVDDSSLSIVMLHESKGSSSVDLSRELKTISLTLVSKFPLIRSVETLKEAFIKV